jgi:hypothetical protein
LNQYLQKTVVFNKSPEKRLTARAFSCPEVHMPTSSSFYGSDVTQIAVRLTDMASLRDDVEIEYEAGR